MAIQEKVNFIHELPADNPAMLVREPFEVTDENRRRFVRIDISSPMTMRTLRDAAGQLWPEGEWHIINGTILNISEGGVLVEVDQRLTETDLVSLHFIMQDIEPLSDVLGQVMRVEREEDCFLVGIKFVTKQVLLDTLSQGELDLLPATLNEFNESVRQALEKYIESEKSASA